MANRIVKSARDVATSLVVALFILLALEVVLRIGFPQAPRVVYRDDVSIALDDSVVGRIYAPLTSGRHTTREFDVQYDINEQGHRDATPYVTPKDTARTRILLLGDSFTFGHGVSYEKTWAVLMEERLNASGVRVDVVNAGIQGMDTRTEYLYLQRIIDAVDPDLVILTIMAHDLLTNRMPTGVGTRHARRRGRSLPQSHAALLGKRLVASNDRLYTEFCLRSSRRTFVSDPPTPMLTRKLALTDTLLGMTGDLCAEHDAGFGVMFIPQLFQVIVRGRGYRLDGVDVEYAGTALESLVVARDFGFRSTMGPLADSYAAGRRGLFHRVDGHLTEDGCSIVADEAAALVVEMLGP